MDPPGDVPEAPVDASANLRNRTKEEKAPNGAAVACRGVRRSIAARLIKVPEDIRSARLACRQAILTN